MKNDTTDNSALLTEKSCFLSYDSLLVNERYEDHVVYKDALRLHKRNVKNDDRSLWKNIYD